MRPSAGPHDPHNPHLVVKLALEIASCHLTYHLLWYTYSIEASNLEQATMNRTKDPVVIRVWKGNPDDVFALFPTDPADNYGRYCTSYQHVGQHSSADYGHCIRQSRPATNAAKRLRC